MRKTITMRGITGTYAELAQITGITEGTLRTWVKRGYDLDARAANYKPFRGRRAGIEKPKEPEKPPETIKEALEKNKGRKLIFKRYGSSSGWYEYAPKEKQ